MQENIQKDSKIVLTNKNELCVFGVTEFISSTEDSVCVKINNEEFVIEGKNLTVTNLDTNQKKLELLGNVNSMYFNMEKSGKFSFKKLFNR